MTTPQLYAAKHVRDTEQSNAFPNQEEASLERPVIPVTNWYYCTNFGRVLSRIGQTLTVDNKGIAYYRMLLVCVSLRLQTWSWSVGVWLLLLQSYNRDYNETEHLDQYFVMAVEMMIEVVSHFYTQAILPDSAGVSVMLLPKLFTFISGGDSGTYFD